MGKSSASLKKKRSKKSSKAKASSRSKSKKYKSRKIHRRKVSLSGSDYDDSASLNTSASSSSEDGYRRTRDQSRTRKDVKGRSKRARRRSYSRDSSEDSLRARKRKRVKRKNDYEVREKPYRKKKPRKEVSGSSLSSRSWSCSTCQGESASSDDSQFGTCRERLKRKEKGKRRLERGRSGSEKSSRYSARSCSSCSSHSENHGGGPEENHIGVNNSRWLRSVITATKEVEEFGELCRNETKEEIVEDHDYPCRSNDSNDGGNKRESGHHTLSASEGKLRVEDEIGNANADFNFSEPTIRDSSYNDSSNLRAFGTRTSESIEKNTSETSGDNPNCDDLESILRQRALENLKKFRGGIQCTAKASDQKNKIISNAKQPITEKHALVQGKSIVNNAAVGTEFNRKTLVEETSLPSGRKDLISYPRNNDRILNLDKGKPDSNKPHSTCALEKVINAGNHSETITESSNYRKNNPEFTKPESCHDLLQSHPSLEQIPVSAENTKDRVTFEAAHVMSQNSNNNMSKIRVVSYAAPKPSSSHGPECGHNNVNKTQDEVEEHSQFESKQTSASNGPPHTKFLVTEVDVEKDAGKNSPATIESINNSSRVVDALCNSATPKSCFESSSVENNSDKLQDGSNQGSQFEQKTMNVMRGGEMVQVNYKVYIPKKAPALARRQLKR